MPAPVRIAAGTWNLILGAVLLCHGYRWGSVLFAVIGADLLGRLHARPGEAPGSGASGRADLRRLLLRPGPDCRGPDRGQCPIQCVPSPVIPAARTRVVAGRFIWARSMTGGDALS
jgi:hypothetical protein